LGPAAATGSFDFFALIYSERQWRVLFGSYKNCDLTQTPNQPMETTMSEANEKALIAQILSSYLSNNTVAATELSLVIETVKKVFGGSGEAASATPSDSVTKTWSFL
jgi:hypothetical protein